MTRALRPTPDAAACETLRATLAPVVFRGSDWVETTL